LSVMFVADVLSSGSRGVGYEVLRVGASVHPKVCEKLSHIYIDSGRRMGIFEFVDTALRTRLSEVRSQKQDWQQNSESRMPVRMNTLVEAHRRTTNHLVA
jgi:hypothetical protein